MVKQGKSTIKKIAEEDDKTMQSLADGSIKPEDVKVDKEELVKDLQDVLVDVVDPKVDEEGEQPSASTSDLAIPTKMKKEKENAVSIKIALKDDDAVSEVFKTEMKNTSKERKQEMVQEMTDEIKSLLSKREFLQGSAKKKDEKTEVYDIELTVKFDEKTWVNTFKSDLTFSSIRDECCHHFGIAKTKYQDHTLLKDNKDLLVVGRGTIGGKSAVKSGNVMTSGSTVFLVKYNK